MSETFAPETIVCTPQEALARLQKEKDKVDERWGKLSAITETQLSLGQNFKYKGSEGFFIYNIRSIAYNKVGVVLEQTDLEDTEKIKEIRQLISGSELLNNVYRNSFQNAYDEEYNKVWNEISVIVKSVNV